MQKPVDYLSDRLNAIYLSGVSPGVIDSVRVNGRHISSFASTHQDRGRIVVRPWDETPLSELDAAIRKAGFDSYVFSKETVVVSSAPILTFEEREKVRTQVRKLGEEARVAVRAVRQKARKEMGKDADKHVQTVTDEFIGMIDRMVEAKLEWLG